MSKSKDDQQTSTPSTLNTMQPPTSPSTSPSKPPPPKTATTTTPSSTSTSSPKKLGKFSFRIDPMKALTSSPLTLSLAVSHSQHLDEIKPTKIIIDEETKPVNAYQRRKQQSYFDDENGSGDLLRRKIEARGKSGSTVVVEKTRGVNGGGHDYDGMMVKEVVSENKGKVEMDVEAESEKPVTRKRKAVVGKGKETATKSIESTSDTEKDDDDEDDEEGKVAEVQSRKMKRVKQDLDSTTQDEGYESCSLLCQSQRDVNLASQSLTNVKGKATVRPDSKLNKLANRLSHILHTHLTNLDIYIDPTLENSDKTKINLLHRYLIASGATPHSNPNHAAIYITRSHHDGRELKGRKPSDVCFVRPEWIVACWERKAMVGMEEFLVGD
ncbi:hypothetical protein HDU76_002973 [Blyttiomyces sp. JEL0837]|nr:hypothetical protein HDU76_002973 [Blyttiomyces sp. JEL0837]